MLQEPRTKGRFERIVAVHCAVGPVSYMFSSQATAENEVKGTRSNEYMKDQIFEHLHFIYIIHILRVYYELKGSNPVQAWIFFFQALISQLLKLCV